MGYFEDVVGIKFFKFSKMKEAAWFADVFAKKYAEAIKDASFMESYAKEKDIEIKNLLSEIKILKKILKSKK